MSNSSVVFLGILLPMSSLVACATDGAEGPAMEDSDNLNAQTGRTPAPAPAPAPARPAASTELAQVSFGDPGHAGSGCPQGVGTVALSADHTTLSVTTGPFKATTGGDITNRRKNCQAAVSFVAPAGIRLGIASANFVGSTSILSGGTGRVIIDRHFAFGATDLTDRSLAGPVAGPFSIATDPGVTWSACGESNILTVSAQLVAGGQTAELTGTSFSATLVAERCQ